MAVDYAVTPAIAGLKDLTDTSVNPDAAPTTTPRQGGFTLRNRINFDNVAAGNKTLYTITKATAATAGNILAVLEVPERVLVKSVKVFAVKSADIPGCSMYDVSGSAGATASGLAASHLGATHINIGALQRSKPLDDDSYVAASHLDVQNGAVGGTAAGGQFGVIATQVAVTTNGVFSASLVEKIDSSMTAPELGQVVTRQADSTTLVTGTEGYFPLGGYVTIQSTPGAGGSASDGVGSFTGDHLRLTGTWEIQADCMYVPV